MGSRRVLRSAVDETAAEWVDDIGAMNALAQAAALANESSFILQHVGRLCAVCGAKLEPHEPLGTRVARMLVFEARHAPSPITPTMQEEHRSTLLKRTVAKYRPELT